MSPEYLEILNKYQELEKQMQDSAIISNTEKYKKISQEFAEYKNIYKKTQRLEKIEKGIKDAKDSLKIKELKELAEQELKNLQTEKNNIENEIKLFLKPRDPNDKKEAILEIRAGAGGDEAALFAAELFRMYSRYSQRHRYTPELVNLNETGIDGIK